MRIALWWGLVGASLSLGSLEVRCTNGVGSPVLFESAGPSFLDAGKVLLSLTQVCGVEQDFKTQCGIEERHEGQEHAYVFRCDDVYGSLYATSAGDGYAEFECHGEKVTAPFTATKYHGCEVTGIPPENPEE